MLPKKNGKKLVDLANPEYYINRELSLIEFQQRVLAEAESDTHPLLERLKFISIFSSNMDEFFMIRVAGLKSQISAGVAELSVDGMTPQEQLKEIRKRIMPLFDRQEKLLNKVILPALEKEEIFIHFIEDLTSSDRIFLEKHFNECIMPLLTPLSLDPAHPFPRLINRSLNIAFVLTDATKKVPIRKVAFLQLPTALPRFLQLERKSGHHFVLLENVIKMYADALFPGLMIETSNTFRVTRDADIEIAEDEAEDLLTEIAEQIKHRKWGTAAVRLEVSTNMPDYLMKLLMGSLDIEKDDVYVVNRPLHLPDFMQLMKIDLRHLKDKPFKTRILPEIARNDSNIFDIIKKHDFIVHHPYDSFTNSTLKLINESAADPDVLGIKITLYRTGLNSPVVEALKKAAENGKSVTAFVELKARFDEENNIIWAKELEHVGVHVIYGVLGLKTHCKIAMIIRREGKKLQTYLHLATGNYNYVTTRLYTDIGFFTSNEDFGHDAMHLFNYLTGYSHKADWNHFIVAPINLRRTLIEFIYREAELSTPENPGFIFAKMNSLTHDEVIQALYKASQRGVKIQLLVRGICCLKPGIKGVSENIEVRSILGRFLEHSRVFYFKCKGKEEIYLSSADWMTRNLQNRVELMFPINDTRIKNQLKELLEIYWKDNCKTWLLQSDGLYTKIKQKNNEKNFCAQQYFLDEIRKSGKKHRRIY
ncbi:MAG: polyphosphate kinase 1 [Bacteroidetes bacterium]|nr:MAG: polyphosphate kinase 1 [Bacteroidota bacterium]